MYVLIENVEGYIYLGQHYRFKETNQESRIKRFKEESWQVGRHTPEETGVQLLRAVSYDTWCSDLDTHQNKHRTNLRPHRPKWKDVCSISHIDRKTNTWVREMTKVIDIVSIVRKTK